MSVSSLIDELRRRRVFRVAAFYGGIAFVIVQIIDGTFEVMGIPAWVSRLIIIILALGFPVSMILAWVFDITPEGIVRTGKVDVGGDYPEVARKAQPLIGNRALALIAVVAVGFGIWRGEPNISTSAEEASVAVLPFATFSSGEDDQFFADGMTDNLITQLYKVSGIKVIARTSVMQYKNTTKRMKEIGEELGVTTLLEGSIQRSANRVIITTQLIDVDTEAHLWAETYDRQIEDIFDIQNEVAKAIAHSLKGTLSPRVETLMSRRPTENLSAYEAYIKGQQWATAGIGRIDIENSIVQFEIATREDPLFAEAWAELAIAHLFYRWAGYEATDARLATAEWALNHAVELAPEHPAVLNAIGRYHYHGFKNYALALESFHKALALEPSNSAILSNIGYVLRRLGNHQQALIYFHKAVEVDPVEISVLINMVNTYSFVNDLENAEKYAKRLLNLNPKSISGYDRASEVLYGISRDPILVNNLLLKMSSAIPEFDRLSLRAYYTFQASNYDESVKLMIEAMKLLPPNDARHSEAYYGIGIYYHGAGQSDQSRVAFRKAANLFRKKYDDSSESDLISLKSAAFCEAHLQNSVARDYADEVVRRYPVTMDAYRGWLYRRMQATIYFMTGEHEIAFEMLEEIFKNGAPNFALHESKREYQKFFDDPRYQTLVANYGLRN